MRRPCSSMALHRYGWRQSVAPALALAAAFSATADLSAQRPRPVLETETELGEAGPLRAGISAGALLVSGEAFYDVRHAPSLQLFLALPVAPFDEVRVGFGYSSHADTLDDRRVAVRSLYVEPLFAVTSGPLSLQYGLRGAYIHQARRLFRNTMHGIGLGGMASLRRSFGPRLAIEGTLALTGVAFPGTDLIHPEADPDYDRWSNAWFREVRIGLVARPW